MEKLYAELYMLGLPLAADRPFSYIVPESDRAKVKTGSIAAAPFGAANRVTYGVVASLSTITDAKKPKELLFILDEPYSLSEKDVSLALYLSEHLFCTVGEAVGAMLPSGLTITAKEIFRKGERFDAVLSKCNEPHISEALEELAQGGQDLSGLTKAEKNTLLRKKAVKKSYVPLFRDNVKDEKRVRLLDKSLLSSVRKTQKSSAYAELCEYLEICGENGTSAASCLELFGVGASSITTLEKHGVLETFTAEKYRTPYKKTYFSNSVNTMDSLSPNQKNAVEKLLELYSADEAKAALLFGVTGSGKSMVFIPLIDKALRDGKSVIFLVPEIALTGQSARLLYNFFGDELAIIHSALTKGERQDVWRAVKNGEKHLILGTRSAVFSPCSDIGLIIIDEEQDASYKSDTKLKYHARNVARKRAAQNNALLLLASATPSVESFLKAENGAYNLIELRERFGKKPLPEVEIADISEDIVLHPDALIGSVLYERMTETLKEGKQVILFMNRRGYQKFMSCAVCGKPIRCPYCSVSLTLHNPADKKLVCHYCGYETVPPDTCPDCGKNHMIYHGYGTEKLEEELAIKFPEYPALRMDADTTGEKMSHDRIISDFKSGEYKILFGTQMVAKGHNFDDVALVGVIMADTSLYLADYRSNENTFSLLTQVTGRAGRGKYEGRAVIQTLSPQHEIIEEAKEQDYHRFFRGEIALRRALSYPPFCEIALIMLFGTNEERLREKSREASLLFDKVLKNYPDVKLIKFGPFDASVYKINNIYRRKFVIKYKDNKRTRSFIREFLTDFSKAGGKDVSVTIDINPSMI